MAMTAASTKRFQARDRFTGQAAHLRAQATAINPRWLLIDTATDTTLDEFASKKAATDTARDLNNGIARLTADGESYTYETEGTG